MSWIKSFPIKDLLIVAIISVFLLGVINLFFVYFSPSLIKAMPHDVVRNISPCYRTIFHHKPVSSDEIEIVFGDSFSEGIGDELLAGDEEYGIFNKLDSRLKNVFVFGRAGYGNLGTLIEYKRCKPLLDRYTSLKIPDKQVSTATFVFYEGNDLNNNLVEIAHKSNPLSYKLSFFVPVFEYGYRKLMEFLGREGRLFISDTARLAINERVDATQTQSGISVSGYPQSAAMELDSEELSNSFNVLESSLKEITTLLPEVAKYQFLYLPSVASSYEFNGNLNVQSYKGLPFYTTTGDENRERNLQLRSRAEHIVEKHGWQFCDTTEQIIQRSSAGVAVHGPIDWSHLNKQGYSIVAERYDECWGEI